MFKLQLRSRLYLAQTEPKEALRRERHNSDLLLTPWKFQTDRPDKGQLLKDPIVLRFTENYGKNGGQILLKFHVFLCLAQ